MHACMIIITNHSGCFLPPDNLLTARLGFEFSCETEKLSFATDLTRLERFKTTQNTPGPIISPILNSRT
jgi:hypothetical protein